MNTTKIQIIELIEPFMDKTLCDGCLIGTGITRDIIWKIIGFEHNHYSNQWKVVNLLDTRHNTIVQGQIKHHKHIYGHYDITAVLKYIKSKGIFTMPQGVDNIYFIDENNNIEYSIPNKPLHLYSEQEEKDLLALLTKIGQTNR